MTKTQIEISDMDTATIVVGVMLQVLHIYPKLLLYSL
jgi:hypothetical protein